MFFAKNFISIAQKLCAGVFLIYFFEIENNEMDKKILLSEIQSAAKKGFS